MSPMKKKDYHPGWREISWTIIHIRAKNCCELCPAENGRPHWKTGSRVVLTTHHIDGDRRNNDFLNLIAVCQRCHLRLDAPYRQRRRGDSTQDVFMQPGPPGPKGPYIRIPAITARRVDELIEVLDRIDIDPQGPIYGALAMVTDFRTREER